MTKFAPGSVEDWLDAALKCKDFHWDADQRECAEAALADRMTLQDRHEATSAPGGAWVSVAERLPEENTEVLIAFKGAALPATGQYTGSPHDHGGWCYPAENGPTFTGETEDDWTVTHWMPLPPHPTEKT